MMAAETDLQRQCQELLDKLKTNQVSLKQSFKLEGDDSGLTSSLENHLQTRIEEKKPEYARQKLRSIMKKRNGVSSSGDGGKAAAIGTDSRSTFSRKTEPSDARCKSDSRKIDDHPTANLKGTEVREKPWLGKDAMSALVQGESKKDKTVDNNAMQDYFQSRTSSSFMEGGTDSFLGPTSTEDNSRAQLSAKTADTSKGAVSSEDNFRPQPSTKPLTPNSVRRRRIIDKNVHVDSKLSEADLEELERDVRGLNFSYSEALADVDSFPLQENREAGKDGDENENNSLTREEKAKEATEASLTYHKSLLDGGNNRQLNNFIKDTTIKPKSLLNSTQSYSSSYSTQGPGVSFQSTASSSSNNSLFRSQAKDRRLLGYDWIAALIHNDAGLMDESESYFHELREFRRSNRDECCNDFYMDGPFTLTQSEPPEVEQALKDTKVQPFTVNERLFTVPVTENLLGEPIEKEERSGRKAEPTKDQPRFVRVSIPRATLQMPYKVRPHRRRSFDASDSCSLNEHCLMGWNAVSPATLPTASSISLSDAVTGVNPKHATTLAEAEKAASTFHWPLLENPRPKMMADSLPTWKKQYMDTTNNFPHPQMSMSLSASLGSNSRSGGGGGGNLREKTNALLDSTYSMMYEMQKARDKREEERVRQTGKAAS